MIINGEELIARQLSVSEVTRITFDGGHETTIHPVSYIPQLCGENNRVSIDGDWQVTRWPFAEDESTLASLMVNDNHWETLIQPGKVFTQDVETAAATISGNWRWRPSTARPATIINWAGITTSGSGSRNGPSSLPTRISRCGMSGSSALTMAACASWWRSPFTITCWPRPCSDPSPRSTTATS